MDAKLLFFNFSISEIFIRFTNFNKITMPTLIWFHFPNEPEFALIFMEINNACRWCIQNSSKYILQFKNGMYFIPALIRIHVLYNHVTNTYII